MPVPGPVGRAARRLGARLARLELTVFLEELLNRVAAVDIVGEPRYTASNFTWGVRRGPVWLFCPERLRSVRHVTGRSWRVREPPGSVRITVVLDHPKRVRLKA